MFLPSYTTQTLKHLVWQAGLSVEIVALQYLLVGTKLAKSLLHKLIEHEAYMTINLKFTGTKRNVN